MWSYSLYRLIYAIPIALAVSVIVFALVYIGPGDPLDAVLPDEASVADIERIRAHYGFDKPLPAQYGIWLWNAVQGDLGKSIGSGRPVMKEVIDAAKNTAILAAFAFSLGFPVAVAIGALAGYYHGGWLDRVLSAVSVTGISIPHYWLGMVLVTLFAVEFGNLPAMGMSPYDSSGWAFDTEHFRHLILPLLTISAIPMAIVARVTRACVAETMASEVTQALRAKGLNEPAVFLHVLRNAAPTIMAVMGLEIGNLLGGSILIETVFAWPGTGFLLNEAILQRDLPVLQGAILLMALFFVVLNLMVDLMQNIIDRRIQRA
ncbi:MULTISPECIES: ABC transporter permease [Halomonadaceae]|uniref:ABC transporter permease n=1 Tax=Halomonadaceae TaxID=28256 RepID=UPI001599CA9F|nr:MULTISPECIES: ABC transporter permease [Halomonas]QJQ95537.1 ABC transporter permease [Halomonas sp. PA5]